jgi:DNA repair protein RecO (recombination protein O)
MLGAFFWRLLSVEGYTPQLDTCVACGEAGSISSFDVVEGGVHCSSCRTGVPISAAALEIMQKMLGGGMNEVLALPDSAAVNEVNQLAMEAIEAHLERRLRSLGTFDRHL